MIVQAYKTHKIAPQDDLKSILDAYLPPLEPRSIVVITSKIVSLCQGDVVYATDEVNKKDLVKKEADFYLSDTFPTPYGHTLTIKNSILIPSSGIDESNGNGYFILWPKHMQEAVNGVWAYLRKKYGENEIGVLISDSHTTPLRWGTSGIGIAWCGFNPLNNYIGSPDIYGRPLQTTKASVLDGLAAAAVAVMGEGEEQTPLAVITDIPFVTFEERTPTQQELASFSISFDDDIYAPLLKSVIWEKAEK